MAGYVLPALAGSWPVGFPRSPAPIWPLLRRSLGVEDHTATGAGVAVTFDDGPHAQGHPPCSTCSPAMACGRHSFSSASRSCATPRSRPRSWQAATGSACTATATAISCASTPWQVREDIARAQATIEDATGVSPTLYRPPYGVLNATALRLARQAGRRTLALVHWGRDWEVRATPESIADASHGRSGGGLGATPARRRRLQRARVLAAHGLGSPARARHA